MGKRELVDFSDIFIIDRSKSNIKNIKSHTIIK